MKVELVGINSSDQEANNPLVAQLQNDLPWLQDTVTQSVWSRWAITYRDVLILDAFNRPVARDNLTTHDLGVAANYGALKGALLSFAVPADTDADGLPDDWEIAWFGNLAARPDGDDDGDGYDNRTEFAFSTNPRDANSIPRLQPLLGKVGGEPVPVVSFRRYGGGFARFVVEASSNLVTWAAGPTAVQQVGTVQNLYDGQGGATVRYRPASAFGSPPTVFLRVRPAP